MGWGEGGGSLVDQRVFTLVRELDLEILNIRLGICKLPSFKDRLPNTLPEPCFCKTARGGVGGWGEGAAGGDGGLCASGAAGLISTTTPSFPT